MLSSSMHLPSLEACHRLMDEYGMLTNIRRHSLVVARLADQILTGLTTVAPSRAQTNRRLVITGALLHDIAKTPCLHGTCNHAQIGAEICLRHGFPEIAPIVSEHVVLRDYNPDRYKAGLFNATELVYYADKRVRHHSVVSLEERLEYILEHYADNDPTRRLLIRENFNKCKILEQHLFQWLPFSPQGLDLS